MARIEWILCDLGKVLVNFDHGRIGMRLMHWCALNPHRLRKGVPGGEDLFRFAFAARDMDGMTRNKMMDTGRASLEWLAGEMDEALGIVIRVDELRPIWCEIFSTTNDQVVESMKRARMMGIKVGISSNTNAPHWEYVKENYPQLEGVWDELFLSYELGFSKTDQEYFPEVARRTGCEAGAHLLIDDLKENCEAAERAAMKAFLYQGKLGRELGDWVV